MATRRRPGELLVTNFSGKSIISLLLSALIITANVALASEDKTNTMTKQPGRSSGQVLTDTNGDTFMEEIPSSQPKQWQSGQAKLVPDLSTVNVPVDPNGHIVPLINKDAGPVLPFYSQFEASVEPLYPYGYPVVPYGYPAVPYVYQSAYPVNPYYWRTQPYPWAYRFSNRAGFGNFAPWPSNPYPPGLSPVNPWFAPPVMTSPWSPGF